MIVCRYWGFAAGFSLTCRFDITYVEKKNHKVRCIYIYISFAGLV